MNKKHIVGPVLVVGAAFGLTPSAAYADEHKSDEDKKVTICHAKPADTAKNGWVQQTVARKSITGPNGHGREHDADIIPPFGDFPGKNWDADGQSVYNNDCKKPLPTPDPTTPKPPVVFADAVLFCTDEGLSTVQVTVSNKGPGDATFRVIGNGVATNVAVAAGDWDDVVWTLTHRERLRVTVDVLRGETWKRIFTATRVGLKCDLAPFLPEPTKTKPANPAPKVSKPKATHNTHHSHKPASTTNKVAPVLGYTELPRTGGFNELYAGLGLGMIAAGGFLIRLVRTPRKH